MYKRYDKPVSIASSYAENPLSSVVGIFSQGTGWFSLINQTHALPKVATDISTEEMCLQTNTTTCTCSEHGSEAQTNDAKYIQNFRKSASFL